MEESIEERVVCIDCDKKNQKDLPSNDNLSSEGMPCEVEYSLVSQCMNENHGQVSSCVDQWNNFKQCHSQQKKMLNTR